MRDFKMKMATWNSLSQEDRRSSAEYVDVEAMVTSDIYLNAERILDANRQWDRHETAVKNAKIKEQEKKDAEDHRLRTDHDLKRENQFKAANGMPQSRNSNIIMS